jgi:hypothetical protein
VYEAELEIWRENNKYVSAGNLKVKIRKHFRKLDMFILIIRNMTRLQLG